MCPEDREDSLSYSTDTACCPSLSEPVTDPAVAKGIDAIVNTLVRVTDLREDFRQEATIHFWRSMSRFPGQKLGWYLTACSMHVHDMLKRGSSLDSIKRDSYRCDVDLASESAAMEDSGDLATSADLFGEVSARDGLREIWIVLKPLDRAILLLLSKGCGICEIAKELTVPHWAISRSRSRIAQVAKALGVTPTGWV